MFRLISSVLLACLLAPWKGAAVHVRGTNSETIHRSLARGQTIDFSSLLPGAAAKDLGNGVTVKAYSADESGEPLARVPLVVVDSANPAPMSLTLGTPHRDFGGKGTGKAGKKGMPFENAQAQGNVLVIDDESTDQMGGFLSFKFDPPRHVESIGLLNNAGDTYFQVFSTDGSVTDFFNGNGGINSFEDVRFALPEVTKIYAFFSGSSAITNIRFKHTCSEKSLVDFGDWTVGRSVEDLGGGITVFSADSNENFARAMIFDTANPTGDDFDLGTPHRAYGGPGLGYGGGKRSLFPNDSAKNHVLIVSEDLDTENPDDAGAGGMFIFKFERPTMISSVGLLDNDKGALISSFTEDGGLAGVSNSDGHGNNNFQMVGIGKPAVTELVVWLSGSGAVTEINTCM